MQSRIRSLAINTGRFGVALGLSIAILGVCVVNPPFVCAGCGLALTGGYLAVFGEAGSL